jgi:hypothetical protein
MQPSLNRRFLALLILSTGALVLPGNVGAESYPESPREPIFEAALLPTEPSDSISSGTFRAIEIELGLTYPSVKQGDPEASSEPALPELAGDPFDPLVGLPIIEAPPVAVARRRGPSYRIGPKSRPSSSASRPAIAARWWRSGSPGPAGIWK